MFSWQGSQPPCDIKPSLRMLRPCLRQLQWKQARSVSKSRYSAKLVTVRSRGSISKRMLLSSLFCGTTPELSLSLTDRQFSVGNRLPYILHRYWTSIIHSRSPVLCALQASYSYLIPDHNKISALRLSNSVPILFVLCGILKTAKR